jgi:hypothetical protein
LPHALRAEEEPQHLVYDEEPKRNKLCFAGALQFTERAGCRPIAAMIQERSTYVFSFCRPANFPHSFAGPLLGT